jgi:hypothetical protein
MMLVEQSGWEEQNRGNDVKRVDDYVSQGPPGCLRYAGRYAIVGLAFALGILVGLAFLAH